MLAESRTERIQQIFEISNIEKALDAISVIKNSNALAMLATKNDPMLSRYHTKIELSIKELENIFDQVKRLPAETNRSLSSKTGLVMSRFSLLEILKSSMPRKIPNSVKINLPQNDFEIYCNKFKLIVLFSNLIENSIQAMNNSGVIDVVIYETQNRVVIEISDSGPGIPPEIMAKLFNSLSSTKENGTGLGTKMAKTIVEKHGGDISVKNNPTTFTIKLPKR